MDNNTLLKRLVSNQNILWFAVLISVAIWLIDGFILAGNGYNGISSDVWFDSLVGKQPLLVSIPISFALYGLSLIMLLSLINTGTFLPFRANLTGALFSLFAAGIFFLHPLQVTSILLPLFIAALNNLFSTFRKKDSKNEILQLSVYIGIGSLFFPWFALLLPVFYIGAAFLSSFSIRLLLAGIISFALPFWIIFGIGLILDNTNVWTSVINQFHVPKMIDYGEITVFQWGALAFIGIPGLSGAVRYLLLGKEKQSSRASLNVLLFVDLTLTAAVFLIPSQMNVLIGLKLVSCSIFNAYLWNTSVSRFSSYLFWTETAGFICLILLNLLSTKNTMF